MSKHKLPIYSICSLTPTPQLPSEFIADDFGHYLEVHKDLHFPHKHSFYHLVYFSNGSGSHSIDFIRFPVTAGQIYFMVPGQVHTWEFDNKPEGYIVNFSSQYLSALIQNPRYLDQFIFFSGQAKEQVVAIPEAGRHNIEQTLSTIISEANATNALKDDFIRAALVQLFIKVNRFTEKNVRSQSNHYNTLLLRNFQQLIEEHFREKRLSKEYAAMLYVTPNHLNALTKDLTGLSAGELIRERVLLEAKRLLINADLSISEIAHELDFIDNSYFSKFFRKYAGATPEAFRKQLHNT